VPSFTYLLTKSRTFVIFFGFILVALLSAVDYLTPPDLSFLVFYMIPVFLVSWFAGLRPGLVLSFVSAISWFGDDVIQGASSIHPVYRFWNVIAKLTVFIVFNFVLLRLKEALLRQKAAEQEKLRQEMEIARQVQSRLFPHVLPRMKNLDYAGICVPADYIGGDYYDFILLGQRLLGIAIGDVVGKGISSALLMTGLYTMVRSYAFQKGTSVAELMQDINQLIYSSTDQNKYATLFYACYDDSRRTLTYVNGGHNWPIWFHSNGVMEELPVGGPVAGLLANAKYQQRTVQLCSGDVLVFYTDGITEARNARNEEFGEQRLIDVINENKHAQAAQLRDRILTVVKNFSGDQPQHDDETLLVLEVV
jgi:sigma-B regulation protein RsbU (phosphoserine phosphatase)